MMSQNAKNQTDKNSAVKEEEKDSPVLIQMAIFASILFVSSLISPLFPASFPVPTPVIGLVLLYLLLLTGVVKLHMVKKFAEFMIGLIAFLFVPSGIQLAASLDIMKQQGWQLIIVIILSTIILLVVTAYTTNGFMWLRKHVLHRSTDVE
ncbi:CidA/LrgA family protein [Levilactobacillus bambusae]|uniref:Murein hydrolase regulator LrgA n=1 Tax=Levilactobacillus bambusae TaxID=2024736 RepID=A0A2V1MX45_9LACO|nr:CidA/LrgA family protein [Levilactobacillus bambusae]PWF99412.1 murein hydrolase regulator LrgA [Levilactobacillus bambusae]